MNIVFEMSTAPGNQHQGLLIENGSGGFLGDIVFNGGKVGASLGNQQFTFRNLTFNNPVTAVRPYLDLMNCATLTLASDRLRSPGTGVSLSRA